jgi:hypothetical protein
LTEFKNGIKEYIKVVEIRVHWSYLISS